MVLSAVANRFAAPEITDQLISATNRHYADIPLR
jgi:hypothetical protein